MNIKKARKELKLSQRDISALFRLSDKTISAWEGGRAVPSALQLHRLSVILDKDVNYFFNKT